MAPTEKNRGKAASGQRESHSFRDVIRSVPYKTVLLELAALALLMVLFFSVCIPKKYDLKVGTIAHETINATKDVVDEVATEEKRTAAANAVEPTYHFQEGVKEEVLSSLTNVFGELRTVQQYGVTLRNEDASTVRRIFSDDEIEYALGLVTLLPLSRVQVTTLMRVDTQTFEDMVSTVTTAVENSLNTTIREGQTAQSIQTILQIVGFKVDISLTQNILPTVLRNCIKPNMTIDEVTTNEARQKAMDSVEPIIYLQGENIIRDGDRITRSQLEMLRSLGLLTDNTYDYSVYLGAFLTILLSLIVLNGMLRVLQKQILTDTRRMMVIFMVIVIGVAMAAATLLLPSVYITPMTLVPLLLTVLTGSRVAVCTVFPMALLISGLITGSSSTTFMDSVLLISMTITGSAVCIWFLKRKYQRIRVLFAGLFSALINFLLILTVKYLSASETLDVLTTGAWAAMGGFLSGVIGAALQPAFETLFRLPTPSKLMEITNPNHPLLRRLMIEAPGTYHHSIIVANLSEAAAERIGANPYLARAGAYYHDIGKLKRPLYFKENQAGENPHEKTDPYVSAAILTSHTKDGVLMAQKEHLPPEVDDIILQHHGDTPVMYFYHKALQMSNGKQVDIAEFRYDGPRPQTKEAAIVMLADTIEAAVRSMKEPTPKAIDQFIEQLVRGKLEDGQLSECPLTLKDIDEVCDAFSGIMKGVHHERIEYPVVQHYANAQAKPEIPESEKKPETAVPKKKSEMSVTEKKSEPMTAEQKPDTLTREQKPDEAVFVRKPENQAPDSHSEEKRMEKTSESPVSEIRQESVQGSVGIPNVADGEAVHAN